MNLKIFWTKVQNCFSYVDMQLKQKALEVQIADLKLQQQQENITAEQTQMQLYDEQVIQLKETEKRLRLQLNADDEKFQQFQVLKICAYFPSLTL